MITRSILLSIVATMVASASFAQIIGGKANNQSTPKEVKAGKISAGSLSGDVNLFTGTYSSSYHLGTVSTPSGTSFSLSMSNSSVFSGGDNQPHSSGIPYGEGWSLDLPSISVSVEDWHKYTLDDENDFVFNNQPGYPRCQDPLAVAHNQADMEACWKDFNDVATKEGLLYWMSPTLNIPGVASGRLVYKYSKPVNVNSATTVVYKHVFVLNTFENYIEVWLEQNEWQVVLGDGTRYFFGMNGLKSGWRTPSNQPLNYDIDATNGFGLPTDDIAAMYAPKHEPQRWYATEIENVNKPNSKIMLRYKGYGYFNYFKEFEQSNTYAGNVLGGTPPKHKGVDNYKTLPTELLLYEVVSQSERLELHHESINPSNGSALLSFCDPSVGRLDSLFSYKTVFSWGDNATTPPTSTCGQASGNGGAMQIDPYYLLVDEDGSPLPIAPPAAECIGSASICHALLPLNQRPGVKAHFNGWKRYSHAYADNNTNRFYQTINPTNPYQSDMGYPSGNPELMNNPYRPLWNYHIEGVQDGMGSITFNHGFLESPRIGHYLPTGDVYELRSKIYKNTNSYCNYDINIVTGTEGVSTGSRIQNLHYRDATDMGYPNIGLLSVNATNPFGALNNLTFYNTVSPKPLAERHDVARRTTILSTFNSPFKWNTIQESGPILTTSNFFNLQALPCEMNGFYIQIGPGNSDIGYNTSEREMTTLQGSNDWWVASQQRYLRNAYMKPRVPILHLQNAGDIPFKGASPNFGTGHPWGVLYPVHKNAMGSQVNDWYNRFMGVVGNTVNNNSHLPSWPNRPTLSEGHGLEQVELIRYAKNPYMLKEVRHYVTNQKENNPIAFDWVLTSKIGFSYGLKKTLTYVLAENGDRIHGMQLENLALNSGAFQTPTNELSTSARPIERNVFLLETITSLPIDGSGPNQVACPITRFEYNVCTTNDPALRKFNQTKALLVKVIDQLGGETVLEYGDEASYPVFINNSLNLERSAARFYEEARPAVRPVKSWAHQTICRVKSKIRKDANNTIKRWDYEYFYPTNALSDLSLGTHFNIHGQSIDVKIGYAKTKVTGPELVSGNRPYTEYFHHTHENLGLLWGKLYRQAEYDGAGGIIHEKNSTYSANLAFLPGSLRCSAALNLMYEDTDYPDAALAGYPMATIIMEPEPPHAFRDGNGFVNTIAGWKQWDAVHNPHLASAWATYGQNLNVYRQVLNTSLESWMASINASCYNDLMFDVTLEVTNFQPMSFLESKLFKSYFPQKPSYFMSYFIKKEKESTITYDMGGTQTTTVAYTDPIEHITEYEYFDATFDGYSTCSGYQEMLGNTDGQKTPRAGYYPLYFEPSWNLHSTKSYSPQAPGEYTEQESYYYYDLKNHTLFGVKGLMLSGPTNGRRNFISMMIQMSLRAIPFESRKKSIKGEEDNPETLQTSKHSTYYLYDADWCASLDEVDETINVNCPNQTPPPPPPIRQPVFEFPLEYERLNLGAYNTQGNCVELAANYVALRKTVVQTDDSHPIYCAGSPPPYVYDQPQYGVDNILQFEICGSESVQGAQCTPDGSQEFCTGPWYEDNHSCVRFNFPFDTLVTNTILSRQKGLLVKEEMDAAGLVTEYLYAPTRVNAILPQGCQVANSGTFLNVSNRSYLGIPIGVISGKGRPDQLVTSFEYNRDYSISSIIDPIGVKLSYEYDAFGRMAKAYKNGEMLSEVEYSYAHSSARPSTTFDIDAMYNYSRSTGYTETGQGASVTTETYIDPLGRDHLTMTTSSDNPDHIVTGLRDLDKWDRAIRQGKRAKIPKIF